MIIQQILKITELSFCLSKKSKLILYSICTLFKKHFVKLWNGYSEKERGIPKRRKHKLGPVKETPFQHAFVMKLFDRSVDLAQFEENTPLYPICRAWMANKPRSFVNAK